MLHVAVDASALRPGAAGMAHYLAGILRASREPTMPPVRWSLLHPRPDELPRDLIGLHAGSSGFLGGRPTETWRKGVLGRRAQAVGADVLWCPTGRGPWCCGIPVVPSVHDLLPLGGAGTVRLPARERLLVGRSLRHTIERASHIIAVSSDTALRLRQRWPDLETPISVLPEAADAHMHEPPTERALAALEESALDRARVWLHVGRLDRRKNLPRLLRAFARARRAARHEPRLVLAGPAGNDLGRVSREIEELGIERSVSIVGWLPDEPLRALYAHAELVVLPSLYEGFGRVALEAMATGRPLIHSGRGALAEVVCGAGWVVDATRVEAIADALTRLGSDPELRARLAARAFRRGRATTWRAVAARTLGVLERAARGADP